MKYILMCMAALLCCIGISWALARTLGKRKNLKLGMQLLLAAGFTVILLLGTCLGYLNSYYHAGADALAPEPEIQRSRIDGGYFFDGPGDKAALIFYPGAKVETIAYAPLLDRLAAQGVDCFLADMPFRMAMFGKNTADKFAGVYSYDTWAIAGHSMGGLVASGYAAEHADTMDALILLAAYPGQAVPDSIHLLSVYGSCDGVLGMEAYEKGRAFWPFDAKEYCIEGGNHAQYADYGSQKGDRAAEISRDEQLDQTVKYILETVLQGE